MAARHCRAMFLILFQFPNNLATMSHVRINQLRVT